MNKKDASTVRTGLSLLEKQNKPTKTNKNMKKKVDRELFYIFQSKSKTKGEIKLLCLRNKERNLIIERK